MRFLLGWLLVPAALAGAQTLTPSASAVAKAIGVDADLRRLSAMDGRGGVEVLTLRQAILTQILLASFDADEMLARIDAEAAHAEDSRFVLASDADRRSNRLNIATFVAGGALGAVGSGLQLSSSLNGPGNSLGIAAGAATVVLSAAELRAGRSKSRDFRSPFNMLAEILGAEPNGASHYPAAIEEYLKTPEAGDGQLPDGVAPNQSLPEAWRRLHRLQAAGGKEGASLASATSDPSEGRRLTAEELADREAMLRDLHGAVALVKIELRAILLAADRAAALPGPAREPVR